MGKHTEVLETLPDIVQMDNTAQDNNIAESILDTAKEECWSIGNSCDGVNFKTSLTQKDSSGSLEVGEQTEVLTTAKNGLEERTTISSGSLKVVEQ